MARQFRIWWTGFSKIISHGVNIYTLNKIWSKLTSLLHRFPINMWCNDVDISIAYSLPRDERRQQLQLLYISLYLLIWGEASNIRFMPECLCYIFHCVCSFLLSTYRTWYAIIIFHAVHCPGWESTSQWISLKLMKYVLNLSSWWLILHMFANK